MSETALQTNGGRTNALQAAGTAIPDALEAALVQGDVAKLSPEHRTAYYRAICESVGLNWMTRPLDLIKGDDGKSQFYFRKEATDQLARAHKISFQTISRECVDDLYIVDVRGTMPDGRSLDDQGIVVINSDGAGKARANAMMRANTKARRRVTLGLVGLGWQILEEESKGAVVAFTPATGELGEPKVIPTNNTALLFGGAEANESRLRATTPSVAAILTAPEPAEAGATPAPEPQEANGEPSVISEKQTPDERKRQVLAMKDHVGPSAKAAGVGVAPMRAAIADLAPEDFDWNHLTFAYAAQIKVWATKAAGMFLTASWLESMALKHGGTPEDIIACLVTHDLDDLWGQTPGLDPINELPGCLLKLEAILENAVQVPTEAAE